MQPVRKRGVKDDTVDLDRVPVPFSGREKEGSIWGKDGKFRLGLFRSEMPHCQMYVCTCVYTHVLTWMPNTFQAHTSDKCVLNEALEDPLIVPPPESTSKGLEEFTEVEEQWWEPVNDSLCLGQGWLLYDCLRPPPLGPQRLGAKVKRQHAAVKTVVSSFSSPGSHPNPSRPSLFPMHNGPLVECKCELPVIARQLWSLAYLLQDGEYWRNRRKWGRFVLFSWKRESQLELRPAAFCSRTWCCASGVSEDTDHSLPQIKAVRPSKILLTAS